MNTDLRQLYQTHLARFAEVVEAFPDEDLEGPLLISPSTYFDQPTKLMVIGQETGGWSGDYIDIDAQVKEYTNFNMGESYRSTPFWNVTRKVEAALGLPHYSCAWSNLNRFDYEGGPPFGDILAEISKLDFLLRDEIRILQPDVCVFYTNRKYDHRLVALYPGLEFHDIDGLPASHFARLSHADLPASTYRTPHPRTMRMKQWEESFITFIRTR